jgi:arsenate reductase (thioredoxin)
MADHYNVLFLCTGNSARSIMAEAILNYRGKPTFTAYSAGSKPTGMVRAEALKQLEKARIPVNGLRSKSWEEFSQLLPDQSVRPTIFQLHAFAGQECPAHTPELHFVFTVCDKAAKEICPVWPGQPMTAHWGVPDPVAEHGDAAEIDRAFRAAFVALDRRIGLFLSLPLASLDRLALKKEIDEIGQQ